ncbi:uncharacterized protein [Eurosta solidaginis]|uniref:uncharacterized protein n=1 Tax=Eurosta solidaginis TaxID=178769 RepID=UPI003530A3BA
MSGKSTSASIPLPRRRRFQQKKAKFRVQIDNPGPSLTISSECIVESRRISISTSVRDYNSDTKTGVLEVVCCSHCSKFENQLDAILKKLEDLQLAVENQNIAIMDEIAGQKVATEQLVRQEAQSAPVTKYFPICKIQELEHLEEKITTANKDVYD